MKKTLAITAALVLAALVGLAVWILSRLDVLVEHAIEHVGTEALDTAVRVGSVHIDLRQGRGEVRDLTVANPTGFSSSPAIRIQRIRIGIDPSKLRSNPIVISEIAATGPAVHLEVNQKGALNLDVLRRRIPASPSGTRKAPSRAQEAGSQQRLLIRRLEVAGGRLEGDASALGQGRVDAKIPTIRLANLEGTPEEIGSRVARTLLGQIADAAARAGLRSAFEKQLEGRLGGQAGEAAKGLLRGLQTGGSEK